MLLVVLTGQVPILAIGARQGTLPTAVGAIWVGVYLIPTFAYAIGTFSDDDP